MHMATARAATLLAGFILSALLLMPVQWLGLKLNLSYARTLPNKYHRFLCKLIGIKVISRGTPHEDGACLIAANHT